MEKSTDEELMNLVLKKNTRALKVLYSRYEPGVFNFILRYTGSREIAQDLLQETFTRVWFAAKTFSRDAGKFKGWLFTIALNITRSEMGKKRYAHHYLDIHELKGDHEPMTAAPERPDVKMQQTDLRSHLAQALQRLKPRLREVIILKHFQQLKFREIAELTQTPEGTLKARFHRAVAELKAQLDPEEL